MDGRHHAFVRILLWVGLTLLTPRAARSQYIDLPGTQPGALADGTPLDNAQGCGLTCHYSNEAGSPSPMPYDGWAGSMMGNAMRDPLFLAALTIADQDRPGTGDYCLRCHTPPGFLAGRTRGVPAASRGGSLVVGDLEGVSCDSCHRMVATTNLGNAQYEISPTDTRFGPRASIESIRHPGAFSAWLADPRMCATCHEITNPVQPQRTADGRDTGRRFPLDTTYSEWARSAFAVTGSPDARTCQDCHMPRISGSALVATSNTAVERATPRRHDFAGANVWAIRMLGAMRNDMTTGSFYDPEAVPLYEAAARRAEDMLRSSVRLEIRQAPMQARPGDRVEVVARITNQAGHRVPTGYGDARRMWLEVALVDADRRETVVSGAYDAAEAHLDEADRQLKIYEVFHGRVGMGHGEHIALHDTVVKDTRLPPRGYRPLPGHEPVGADYSGGEGGALRHWDDARFMVTIPAAARGALTVRVRARYQSTTREYVEFLARENRTDDRGRDLLRRYEASGRAAPFNMAEATAVVTVAGAASPDAGAPDGATPDVVEARDGAPLPAVTADGGCRVAAGRHGRGSLSAFALALACAMAARRRARAGAQPGTSRPRASDSRTNPST